MLVPLALLLQTSAFTWVDAIKIVLIPLIFLALSRIFNRHDKSTDEERADAKAKAKAQTEEAKREREEMAEKLNKMQARLENHESRHTGHDQALERAMDTVGRDIKGLEKQVEPVNRMREEVVEIRAEMKRLVKIEDKLDRLTEILTDKVK